MGRDQSSSGVDSGVGATSRDLADAHREMLADKQLQFDFSQYNQPEPPKWLEALGKLLESLSPLLYVVFWIAVAAVALGIIYLIVTQLMKVQFGGRPGAPLNLGAEPEWRPTVEQARVLLADADALAAEGRFAEAAHHLLLRGVQDIRESRPGLVRPALTSRDIAALDALGERARAAFGAIALVVERSLFGGRDVVADDWRTCRKAYEDFALGRGA
jgi:hypothetical protein